MSGQGWTQKWLVTHPPDRHRAVLYALAAVVFPTVIRHSVASFVIGWEYSPFLPFVLLSAVLLGWRYAAFITLADAIVMLASCFYVWHRHYGIACDGFALGAFLTASAAIILCAELLRRTLERVYGLGKSDARRRGIIFSLDDGETLASWAGDWASIRLGPDDEVAEMMTDYLAQREVGKRLSDRDAERPAPPTV